MATTSARVETTQAPASSNSQNQVVGGPKGRRSGQPAGGTTLSGKPLRGPEQHALPIDLEASSADANVLRTPAIEAEHVRKVYDSIADHWNNTRYKAWPGVERFILGLQPGSVVADLGCGNGKNLPAVKDASCYAIASDACVPLVQIARDATGASVLAADCLNTPFRDASFDAVLSIAVLHHLSNDARRVQALREGARLLRHGGTFLIYCWSQEQDAERSRSRHRFAAQDVLVPWKFRQPGVRKKKASADSGDEGAAGDVRGESVAPDAGFASSGSGCRKDDAEIEQRGADTKSAGETGQWSESPEDYQRYCHVYKEGELDGLLAQVPELEVTEIYFDTGNWCVVARRLAVKFGAT